jgi:hypothetical protein
MELSPFNLLKLCIVLWTTTFSQFVASANCTIKPLVWPIHNQSFVDTNGEIVAVNRGLSVTFPGNNPLSLRLTFAWNDTRLRSAADCAYGNSTYFNYCEGASGSVLWPNSTGFTQINSQGDGLTDPPPIDTNNVVYGEVEASFFGNTSLPIPIEIYSKDFGFATPYKSFLALGPKSAVLQRLLDGQLIPSKVIGLFFGSRSVSNPTNGE